MTERLRCEATGCSDPAGIELSMRVMGESDDAIASMRLCVHHVSPTLRELADANEAIGLVLTSPWLHTDG